MKNFISPLTQLFDRAEVLRVCMQNELDPHKITAAMTNNCSPEEVTKEQRNAEKRYNYIYFYSANNIINIYRK